MLFLQPQSLLLSGGFAIAVVFLISATACGGDSPQQGSQSDASIQPQPYVRVDSISLGVLIDGTSQFQSEILDDGIVTYDEYERSALAEVACLREAGIAFYEEPSITATNRYHWSLFFPDDANLEHARSEAARCNLEYTDRASMAWSSYKAPGEEEILQSARDHVAECLRLRGIDAPQHPGPAEMVTLQQASIAEYAGCLAAAQETLNLPGFGG